jgi:hypothetical protein
MDLLSTHYLVSDHIDGLVREAEAARLLRVAHARGNITPGPWRRALGRGARGLSFALGAASARLDPTLERGERGERTPLRA